MNDEHNEAVPPRPDGSRGIEPAPGGPAPAPASGAPVPAAPAPAAPVPAAPASPASPGQPAVVEAPSTDVVLADEAPRLPGEHRGGFRRLPTAAIDVTEAQTGPLSTWVEPQRPSVGLAGWALGFSIVGLAIACVVGWGFPIGIGSSITAIVALRRPLESRGVAMWALALGLLSVLYSAGWLIWAAQTADLFA